MGNKCEITDPCASDGGATLVDSGTVSLLGGYDPDQNCEWHLSCSDTTLSPVLSFTAFATEHGYDYVRIFEGDEITGEPAWALTGTSLPEAVAAAGAALVVQFVSDDTEQEDGFIAESVHMGGAVAIYLSAQLRNLSRPKMRRVSILLTLCYGVVAVPYARATANTAGALVMQPSTTGGLSSNLVRLCSTPNDTTSYGNIVETELDTTSIFTVTVECATELGCIVGTTAVAPCAQPGPCTLCGCSKFALSDSTCVDANIFVLSSATTAYNISRINHIGSANRSQAVDYTVQSTCYKQRGFSRSSRISGRRASYVGRIRHRGTQVALKLDDALLGTQHRPVEKNFIVASGVGRHTPPAASRRKLDEDTG
jgi:hypothetical protein